MISTRQLRYFVEIADSGSFSAAAERLFVAQSALSRQIKELETQLQTPLFERTALHANHDSLRQVKRSTREHAIC